MNCKFKEKERIGLYLMVFFILILSMNSCDGIEGIKKHLIPDKTHIELDMG